MTCSLFLHTQQKRTKQRVAGGTLAELEDQVVTLRHDQDKTGLQRQVDSLQRDKAELEGRLATLQQDMAALQGQVDSLQQNKTELERRVAALQQENVALQGQVTTLQQHKTKLERQLPTTRQKVAWSPMSTVLNVSCMVGPYVSYQVPSRIVLIGINFFFQNEGG